MQVTIIDPPSGWKYGFPRVHNRPNHQSLEEWLVEKGYPKEDAKWASENCRYWMENQEDNMDIEHTDLTGTTQGAIMDTLDSLKYQLDTMSVALESLKTRLESVEMELDEAADEEMQEFLVDLEMEEGVDNQENL
jgi:hypothetical protein|tara:strand:- start:269 stop:673 length:405 start_codon:yes stop_codon:yes gene_type:complete